MTLLARFAKDESGATAIEYGLIAAGISVAIIAVVQGALHLGRRVCGPGSSFFIPGNTLYGFRAGPEGCRYLNFRARADSTFFTKEDIVDARA